MTKARYVRSFSAPDEMVELGPVTSSIITFGGLTIAHDVHQPGWRWSTHMKPAFKTDSCQVRHIAMVLKGRLHVQLDDGAEFEAGPLELIDIPAGHDAWVVDGARARRLGSADLPVTGRCVTGSG